MRPKFANWGNDSHHIVCNINVRCFLRMIKIVPMYDLIHFGIVILYGDIYLCQR